MPANVLRKFFIVSSPSSEVLDLCTVGVPVPAPVDEVGEVALVAELAGSGDAPAPGDCCMPMPLTIEPDRGGIAGIPGAGDGDGRTPAIGGTPGGRRALGIGG